MLSDADIATIRESFRAYSARADDLAARFFANLFTAQPPLRALVPRDARERDRDLIAWLGMVVNNAHRIESMTFLLEDAGVRCQRAGVQPQHLGFARDALTHAMRQIAAEPTFEGPRWDGALENAWTEALNIIVSLVIRGAGRARARAA